MANFKNGKPRRSRAGCHMCKPQKGGFSKLKLGHRGFGNIRKEIVARDEVKRWK